MQALGSVPHNQHVCLQELGKSIFQFFAQIEFIIKSFVIKYILKDILLYFIDSNKYLSNFI